MGLIETLKSWVGLGGDDDRTEAETTAGDTDTADAFDEDAADAGGEPRLDPEGATETRVETTATAVDALREARKTANTPGRAETTEAGDPPKADDEDGSGDTVDADDPTGE
jgi:hypothetical protein